MQRLPVPQISIARGAAPSHGKRRRNRLRAHLVPKTNEAPKGRQEAAFAFD